MPLHLPTDRMTLGLAEPLSGGRGPVPDLQVLLRDTAAVAKHAEDAGATALWFRDVPLLVDEFRDAGQILDPFTHMAYLAAHTSSIGLATASTVLTLRHPIHVAKQAASVDQLSGGRVALGVATGDRPEEFPAFKRRRADRADDFRHAVGYVRALWRPGTPRTTANRWGGVDMGIEMLPKPVGGSPIPLYVTGHCGQTPEWIAEHGDGWMYYGQDLDTTAKLIRGWRDNVARACGTDDGGVDVVKPYITTLTLDLLPDPDAEPKPLRYGFRAGRTFLLRYLERLAGLGVDHVILGLRASRRPVPDVLDELGEHVFPVYPR
ncbi:MAG TPA: TIGR03571 family LLM class oxidoreductase [Corynebacterium xerosis]|uniref:TIGR03571 family LLM class oxidoreductase n=1 Tax=Corynebacterium xerosis TaxID=1725 RepID=UPI001D7DF317|nr:TIGR03571 family LLM class oxidoreductase [Corynebacterium xerosis]HJG57760.1 TIGR03571 family LLM class oxidoreductase [Corynebacterium xerosis]